MLYFTVVICGCQVSKQPFASLVAVLLSGVLCSSIHELIITDLEITHNPQLLALSQSGSSILLRPTVQRKEDNDNNNIILILIIECVIIKLVQQVTETIIIIHVYNWLSLHCHWLSI